MSDDSESHLQRNVFNFLGQGTPTMRGEREESPMSCRSVSGLQPRNFHSYYPGSSDSYRNMYNGSSGAPMPVTSNRTIDSNTSVSAKEIAFALQNCQFDMLEEQILRAACSNYMKNKFRRQVEKRRNTKMFLTGFLRRSGGDSGDQASISSNSDDNDCGSIRSSRSTLHNDEPSCSSTITDMVRDFSDDFRQSYLKHNLPVGPPQVKNVAQPKLQNTLGQRNIPLTSQRFNRSSASTVTAGASSLQSICEDSMLETRAIIPNKNTQQANRKNKLDSEQDYIWVFDETTIIARNKNGKRCLREEDVPVPDCKKSRVLSPPKNNNKPKTRRQKQLNTSVKQKTSNFEFANPQLPIKKLSIVKNTQKVVSETKSQNSTTARKSHEVKDLISKPADSVTESMVPNLMDNSEGKLISSSLTAKPTPALESKRSPSRPAAIDEQEKEQCPTAKLTPEHVKELSPTGNGLTKAIQAVKSFWDDNSESDCKRTPMKRSTQMNPIVFKPVDQATVDTVLEDVSSVSGLMNSANNKASNVTLQRLQAQTSGNKKQTAPKVQKATKDTKQSYKQNSNMEDSANNKEIAKIPTKTTDEAKTPVKIVRQVNNKGKKAASAAMENQPPAKKRRTAPKTKPKLNTMQKKADEENVQATLTPKFTPPAAYNLRKLPGRKIRSARQYGSEADQ